MIPAMIRFTGLTVPSADLLYGFQGRKLRGIPPAHWTRVEVLHDQTGKGPAINRMDAWLAKTISGKWASHEVRHGSTIVICFEDDNDALLFKLMEGHEAWKQELEQFQ